MSMLLFIFGVIGMTHILVDSVIMEPVERWVRLRESKHWLIPHARYALFECHQCSGFWCGLAVGVLIVSVNPLILVACGCAGSFLGDASKLLLDRLEGSHGED